MRTGGEKTPHIATILSWILIESSTTSDEDGDDDGK
jgi:hypothetical protein